MTLLPVFYLGPLQYYSKVLQSSDVLYEIHEFFQKQTYRNRCCIYGANGKQDLIVPIKHSGEKKIMKDVLIANEVKWQRNHWRSIEASYRSSGFFEFYEYIFAPYYEKEYKFLLDFNLAFHEAVLQILEVPFQANKPVRSGYNNSKLRVDVTYTYEKEYPERRDLRNFFTVSTIPENVKDISYPQVFSDKFGFIPNLSILDLVFNVGPDAIATLGRIR